MRVNKGWMGHSSPRTLRGRGAYLLLLFSEKKEGEFSLLVFFFLTLLHFGFLISFDFYEIDEEGCIGKLANGSKFSFSSCRISSTQLSFSELDCSEHVE